MLIMNELKTKKIIINGKAILTDLERVGYNDIVKLVGLKEGYVYSMVYLIEKSGWEKSGFLYLGKGSPILDIEDGMMFDVCDTSNA